jgi:hypothetical protein
MTDESTTVQQAAEAIVHKALDMQCSGTDPVLVETIFQTYPELSRGGPAEMAARYGAATAIPDWSARLLCSRCGSRQTDIGPHRD